MVHFSLSPSLSTFKLYLLIFVLPDFKYALVLEPMNKTANAALTRLQKLFQ